MSTPIPNESVVHYIRLTKQSDKGTIDNHPIHEGYQVYGIITDLPKVGFPLRITRTRRNGINALGVMTTSLVTEVFSPNYQELDDQDFDEEFVVFSTANSTYRLDFLTKEEYLKAHGDDVPVEGGTP